MRCTDGSAMLAAAADDPSPDHHGLNTLRGVHRCGSYHSRLKAWLQRFYGVATSYLPH